MKIRSSFVSNSSSSSYIIEFENYDKSVVIAGEEISINDFLDAIEIYNKDYETEMHETTQYDNDDKKSLIQYVQNCYDNEYDENTKADLISLKDDIKKSSVKKGPFFARFDISYANLSLRFLFKLLSKYELFKIRMSSTD